MSQDRPPAGLPPPQGPAYLYAARPTLHTGNGWYRLATALRLMLVLNAFVYTADLAGSWWSAHRLQTWLDDPTTISVEDGQRIDNLTVLVGAAEVLLWIVTAALFICWLYQAYGRPLAERSALRMKRGWSIGGWFIPFAGYILPYRVVQGVNCATSSPPRGDSLLVMWWWGAFVVFNILTAISIRVNNGSSVHHGRRLIREIRVSEIWAAVSAAPGLVAAILATMVVAQLTARVREVSMPR